MNDGLCDCATGLDEPGTGACASTLQSSDIVPDAFFHCADTSQPLHPAFVDDGVCDCADSSDEAGKCMAAPGNGALLFGSRVEPSAEQRLAELHGPGWST